MSVSVGDKLGPYEILAPLGAGGMGEVWKARDLRLGRIVAIKLLKGQHGDRFQREARAVATLNHPNICQIHDVGPDYLVLEYIEGNRLRGPLPAEETIRLAVQIADGLEEAHGRGVLHRDLKPDNIMVTTKGSAKLLDFGLAKLVAGDSDSTRTMEGAVMGTVAYMSPEQAQGKPLDARSDVFSFGAVLYEMLSGKRAFIGDGTAEVLSAVLRDDPAPLEAPTDLVRIVTRCLRKAPAARFQTIGEVKSALEQVHQNPAEERPSIAVLAFANMSSDPEQEYFSDGLAEEIINLLAHIPGLRVIARTSAFAFKGKHEDVRRIAEVLGVGYVLEGSVRRAGSRIRVTAQLITATDGTHLWSERYDREMADVFAIQDEIAQAIAEALKVKLAGKLADRRKHTPALPAYEAFLRGRHHLFRFTPESFALARECLERSIALDPEFAQPHALLGLSYLLMGTNGLWPTRDALRLARAGAQKALELDPSEPDPHFLLGAAAAAMDYDWREAAEQFRLAMAADSVTADAYWAYAALYLSPLGRFHESSTVMQKAVEQDPLNAPWRAIWANHLNSAGMLDRALEETQKTLELEDRSWTAHLVQGHVYLQLGRLAEAIAAAEKAHQRAPWTANPTGLLAGLLARIGERERAEVLLREMGDSPTPIWGRALYHLLSSEMDAAADWFEKMIEQRDIFAVIQVRSPIVKALREHPRWPKLAKMMNLPEG